MKFKYLIIAFSIIIVIIILVTVLLPVLLAASADTSNVSLAVNFRYLFLPLLIFMVMLLVCMSIFFFLNYRLLSLLEREDWPALAYYLEQKIYVKGRYSARNVRILASSYLVISDYQSVLKLESKTQLAKPALVSKNALIFGSARILSGSYSDAAVFFRIQMSKCKSKDKQWMRWFGGFSQLLTGAFNMAEPDFVLMAISSNDALITGLSAYFLSTSLEKKSQNPEKCKEAAKNGKERVLKSIKNINNWKKEADKTGTDIHIAIIRKYIDEAGIWLYDVTS